MKNALCMTPQLSLSLSLGVSRLAGFGWEVAEGSADDNAGKCFNANEGRIRWLLDEQAKWMDYEMVRSIRSNGITHNMDQRGKCISMFRYSNNARKFFHIPFTFYVMVYLDCLLRREYGELKFIHLH